MVLNTIVLKKTSSHPPTASSDLISFPRKRNKDPEHVFLTRTSTNKCRLWDKMPVLGKTPANESIIDRTTVSHFQKGLARPSTREALIWFCQSCSVTPACKTDEMENFSSGIATLLELEPKKV
jgi:hypothetical protein